MKHLKKAAALLLAVLMTVSLCSCKELDDLRKAQAFWTAGDAQSRSIVYQQTVYRPLTSDNWREMSIQAAYKALHVTAQDVPVLLSRYFDAYGYYYVGHGVIECEGRLYADDEHYDAFTKQLETTTLDYIGYQHNYVNEKGEYRTENLLMSEEERSAVQNAIARGSILGNGENRQEILDAVTKDAEYCEAVMDMYYCDADLFFSGKYLVLYQTVGNSTSVPGNLYLSVGEEFYAFSEAEVPIMQAWLQKNALDDGKLSYPEAWEMPPQIVEG